MRVEPAVKDFGSFSFTSCLGIPSTQTAAVIKGDDIIPEKKKTQEQDMGCLCHLGIHDGDRIDCPCKIHHGSSPANGMLDDELREEKKVERY